MNIIESISDPRLFRKFLADKNDKLSSWSAWNCALRLLYGLPVKKKYAELVKLCTGRRLESFNADGVGFNTALFLIGRRGGKSRIASIIGAFEATLSGKEESLAAGETGMVSIISPSKKQGRIIKNYSRAIFDTTPLLENEVVPGGNKESFQLENGILFEILVGDWRAVRGYTLLACILDELCFFGLTEESKVKNDTELVNAIKPSLSTLNGKLIGVSTKYAKKGYAYRTWKKNYGNEKSKVLVWEADTITMNPTFPLSIVNAALVEDLASAKSEYLNEWREDIKIYLPREVIESVVKKGRQELLPRTLKYSYFAFADVSGGRVEDSAVAIAHRIERKVIVDFIKLYKSPHDPISAIRDMSQQLKKFAIKKITGDNYAAEFVKSAFNTNGIRYEKCSITASQLYIETIPIIGSSAVELLDNETLINQFSSLLRFTRSGGKDKISHGQGQKDDLCNAVAGVIYCTAKPKRKVGAFFTDKPEQQSCYAGENDYADEPSRISILSG